MYKLHTKCRACGSSELEPVFDLGLQPLANDFCYPGDPRAGYAPLAVLFCPRCTLSQLSVTVDPKVLYANYPYVTSKSETMRAHFQLLWQAINSDCKPASLVEIGSNDGDFLEYAWANGATVVCGIDPARNLADAARQRGITTFTGCLDRDMAQSARGYLSAPASCIVARHVFCHVDDWRQFIQDLTWMSNDDTLVVIEVPWVMDLLQNTEFDTIYHEHTSYLSVEAMDALLKGSDFFLHRVLRFPIHGGSLVLMLRHRDSGLLPDESVMKFKFNEEVTRTAWEEFSLSAGERIRWLRDSVELLNSEGRIVAGYGASAKSTVWVNACRFTPKEIRFITDTTPQKIGRVSPGTEIPIMREEKLGDAEAAICFAWNFFAEISRKHQAWSDRGGQWILPNDPPAVAKKRLEQLANPK